MQRLSGFGTGLTRTVRSWVPLTLAAVLAQQTGGAEARFYRIASTAASGITSVSADGTVRWTNAATGITCTIQIATDLARQDWADYIRVPITERVTTQRWFDPAPPSGMVFVPAGIFTMGDPFREGYADELPTHTVYVSALYMDKF